MNIKAKNYFLFLQQLTFLLLVSVYSNSCKPSQGTTSESSKSSKENHLTDKAKMNFDVLFFDANKEKILGNFDLAETYFSKALQLDPDNAATIYELAGIYVIQKNYTKALAYSKKAAQLDSKNVWYLQLYANCLKQNKQPQQVAEVYETLVKNNPDKMEFYYELANAYLFSNNSAKAIKTYDRAEMHFGITEDISMQKINLFKATKQFEKALGEINKLINAHPKVSKYYGMLGELYQAQGKTGKAFEAFTALLKIEPENALVHLSLADYYRNQKQNDEAFEEIKIAFRNKELDIDTKIKILLSYYSLTESFAEMKSDAMELCRIIVDIHADDAKSFSMFGDFLYRDKKNEEARTQYRKAIALDKEKYALWNQLMILDSDLSDFTSLEKDSKDAMEYFPTQPLPYFFNGAANIQFKKYKEAINSLTQGKEFVIENKLLSGQFYAYLGDANNFLKKYTASDSAYDKALEYDSENVFVLNNYSYYLSLRKINLEKAEKMSKKSNELSPNNNSYQDTYGWILFQSLKYDDAKVWIGKALDNGGRGNGTLLEHYGDVLFKLGETVDALQYWNDAKKAGGGSDLLNKKIADKKIYE